MSDLDEQIRAYFDATSTPVTASMVIDEEPVAVVDSGRRSRRWAMATATGLTTAACLVVLLFLIRADDPNGEPNPVIAPAPTPTAAPTTTSALPPTSLSEGGVAIAWQAPNGGWTGSTPHWVTAYPTGGFVASGRGISPMYSADGSSWSPELPHGSLGSPDDMFISGSYALTNFDLDFPELLDSSQPWDGRGWIGSWENLLRFEGGEWSVVELGARPVEPPVISNGATLIALGEHILVDSGDGSFERSDNPWGPSTGPISEPQYFALPGGGFGAYAETGNSWASTDGRVWTEVPSWGETGLGGPRVMTFEVFGDVVLSQRWDTPTLWSSSDGLTWTSVEPPGTQGGRRLHASDDVLLISEDGALWYTTDLLSWIELPLPSAGGAIGISVVGNDVFVFSREADATIQHGVISTDR